MHLQFFQPAIVLDWQPMFEFHIHSIGGSLPHASNVCNALKAAVVSFRANADGKDASCSIQSNFKIRLKQQRSSEAFHRFAFIRTVLLNCFFGQNLMRHEAASHSNTHTYPHRVRGRASCTPFDCAVCGRNEMRKICENVFCINVL